MSAARRRACVVHVTAKLDVSERFACRVLGQHRSTQRKAPGSGRRRPCDSEAALTGAIVELARGVWALRLPPDHGLAAG